jgi:hypothetical protein
MLFISAYRAAWSAALSEQAIGGSGDVMPVASTFNTT